MPDTFARANNHQITQASTGWPSPAPFTHSARSGPVGLTYINARATATQ